MGNDQITERIKTYLRSPQVQTLLRQNLQQVQTEATFSIGEVCKLFHFTEVQLRSWEPRLLKPLRSGPHEGRRRYTFNDLRTLAIIRILLNAHFQPGEIPSNIEEIWLSINSFHNFEREPFDDRITKCYTDLFWRFFISRLLRILLTLIGDEMSIATVGLVLPLAEDAEEVRVDQPYDFYKLGLSFVSMLKERGLFYAAIEPGFSFHYPDDYRVEHFQLEDSALHRNVIIVVPRTARRFRLNKATEQILRAFLLLLYRRIENWRSCFSPGMRDVFDVIRDYESNVSEDFNSTLNSLTDIAAELGGLMPDGTKRWTFCCITMPDDPEKTLFQRSITVQAQSSTSPYEVGVNKVLPTMDYIIGSISLQALQSGRLIYRPSIGVEDPIAYKKKAEGDIRSAIAIPIGAETGIPVGIVYLASSYNDAFSTDDQRLLRVMGKIMEETIVTHQHRQMLMKGLKDLRDYPYIVDLSLREVLSSNEFVRRVEELVEGAQVYSTRDAKTEGSVSFLAMDVDNLDNFARVYGDDVIKQLNKAVYNHIKIYIRPFLKGQTSLELYYVYRSRFYCICENTSLEDALEYARRLKDVLKGEYRGGILENGRSHPPLAISTNETVTLAVTTFSSAKLREVMKDYSYLPDPVIEARAQINLGLDTALQKGADKGGNSIILWNYPHDFKVLDEVEHSLGERDFRRD